MTSQPEESTPAFIIDFEIISIGGPLGTWVQPALEEGGCLYTATRELVINLQEEALIFFHQDGTHGSFCATTVTAFHLAYIALMKDYHDHSTWEKGLPRHRLVDKAVEWVENFFQTDPEVLDLRRKEDLKEQEQDS